MIEIPFHIDDAKVKLGGLDQLLTAKQWERSAIVYAFTHRPPAQDQTGKTSGLILTYQALADHGIAGLRSAKSVGTYHDNWQAAIDADKAKPVQPGDVIEVPDMDWPPNPDSTSGTQRSIIAQARRDPTVIPKTVKALEPEARVEVARQLMDDPDIRQVARQALDQRYEDAPKPHPVEPPRPQPIDLVLLFRDLHMRMERIVQTVAGGGVIVSDAERNALLKEVEWLRAALDHTESGIRAGSLDQALRAFQEEWL